jgi:hypothetical protein
MLISEPVRESVAELMDGMDALDRREIQEVEASEPNDKMSDWVHVFSREHVPSSRDDSSSISLEVFRADGI